MRAVFSKSRLEAFSDGVIAIIITIMVLELKVPHVEHVDTLSAAAAALRPMVPVFLGYVLSFLYVGIYWNNHHHMLHTVPRISGGVLWANLHLLFWLSLIPFVTEWNGETGFAAGPTALYGVVLLCCALAYTLLQSRIIRAQGGESLLRIALGRDIKGKASLGLYAAGIGLSFVEPIAANALYAVVALIWLVPDRRIEQMLASSHGNSPLQLGGRFPQRLSKFARATERRVTAVPRTTSFMFWQNGRRARPLSPRRGRRIVRSKKECRQGPRVRTHSRVLGGLTPAIPRWNGRSFPTSRHSPEAVRIHEPAVHRGYRIQWSAGLPGV